MMDENERMSEAPPEGTHSSLPLATFSTDDHGVWHHINDTAASFSANPDPPPG